VKELNKNGSPKISKINGGREHIHEGPLRHGVARGTSGKRHFGGLGVGEWRTSESSTCGSYSE